ncbi:TM2 domain-containing protein [Segnochrobactrum spirostomi]|uniref:TM2 domain-containing protein n=1 Tax=Segnochrobactrum spirostomi TaxID=2608987 RepID=A0A6A7Y4V3_9HYPH|nr:TM2 domain-containing protein [Segnochrobactrum spirostomi]MQT13776.1 TM2 domain-containing protein [Segnochrobactrum spirostomi]
MGLSTQDEILIETRVANDGPNVVLAYVFWFFLGIVSAHRFYLGRPGSAILQILTYFIAIGFVWWVVDLFLIPRLVWDKQERIRQDLALRMLSGRTL